MSASAREVDAALRRGRIRKAADLLIARYEGAVRRGELDDTPVDRHEVNRRVEKARDGLAGAMASKNPDRITSNALDLGAIALAIILGPEALPLE